MTSRWCGNAGFLGFFFMKHQDQAFSPELEKRLRFLDEFKRIRDEAAGETAGVEGEKDGEEPHDLSPSSEFFLAK